MKDKSKKSTYSTTFGVDPNFGVFRADEYPAASGLNTGFAGHRNPANRVDTGFDAKCRNKKAASV